MARARGTSVALNIGRGDLTLSAYAARCATFTLTFYSVRQSVVMSSVSRDCDSVPPIASIADAQDGEQEHAATDPSSGTEAKSDSESEASTDRASTPPVSRDQSHRASPVQADLIPNPGFSHVRSWLRVPVPAGRDAELGVIKVSAVAKCCIETS